MNLTKMLNDYNSKIVQESYSNINKNSSSGGGEHRIKPTKTPNNNHLKEMLNSLGNWDKWATNACKLVTFDAWYRNPSIAMLSRTYEEANPTGETIDNIRLMVKRSVKFFHERGSVISMGFDFAPSGYTATVHSGDGDFLVADTLWDMKVHRNRLRSKTALQVLMYWIMGQHSGQEIFKNITKIGLYNPRQNVAYKLDVSKIPAEVIREVEGKVICY